MEKVLKGVKYYTIVTPWVALVGMEKMDKKTLFKERVFVETLEDLRVLPLLKPSYLVCNTCGKPYPHTRFSDDFYCDDCLADRNRMVGTE